MTNHEIIGQALNLMREPLSGYILQQLLSIPDIRQTMHGGSRAFWVISKMSGMSTALHRLHNMQSGRMPWI